MQRGKMPTDYMVCRNAKQVYTDAISLICETFPKKGIIISAGSAERGRKCL